MSGTYLFSKDVLDKLLNNDKFVYRAKLIVNSDKGTPEYLTIYRAINNLLKELEISKVSGVVIVKSDGGVWYSNISSPEKIENSENYNVRPEFFSAVNYAFGNPITNTKIYPKDLQTCVSNGYGLAERKNTNNQKIEQYVVYTYKPNDSPLSTNVFTLCVLKK